MSALSDESEEEVTDPDLTLDEVHPERGVGFCVYCGCESETRQCETCYDTEAAQGRI